jgi:hypothetical protein
VSSFKKLLRRSNKIGSNCAAWCDSRGATTVAGDLWWNCRGPSGA